MAPHHIKRCREAARTLLRNAEVMAPEEIDLATIAWHVGRLAIQYGGLESAEGRIVAAAGGGGTIRVKHPGHPGRQRFTIAHEIGHYVLHKRGALLKEDVVGSFVVWKDANEEAEANVFAAELLMPEYLFRPMSTKETPSLALIGRLAKAFTTSRLASAYQYIGYTNEQVALVVSEGEKIQWFEKSKAFWPIIRRGTLHAHSAAGERWHSKATDSGKMVPVPAYAWLENFDDKPEKEVMEDSRYFEGVDRTLTLLWLEEDLSEE